MHHARRTFLATGTAALLAAAGVTAAVAADPAPAGPPEIAFLANGRVPADALAAGPIAAQLGAPIYTTEQGTLSPEAASALGDGGHELIVVLGGPVAIADAVVDQVEATTGLTETSEPTPAGGIVRAAGENRFATATEVAALLSAYDPAFLPVGAQALDADTLDGQDASAFQPAGDYVTGDVGDAFVPVAVLKVWTDGSIWRSRHRAPVSGEPTSRSTGTGEYEVTLPDVYYSVQHDHAICTVVSSGVPAEVTTSGQAGKLEVRTWDMDGNPVDAPVQCAIYL